MMDALSSERFAKIVVMNPAALTEDDASFLRARSSYLNYDQKVKFAEVLGLPNKPASEPEAPADETAPATGEPEAATPKRRSVKK